jgi:hypothetical protein
VNVYISRSKHVEEIPYLEKLRLPHPNKENTGNDEFQNVQRESKHGFLFCGNYILKYW